MALFSKKNLDKKSNKYGITEKDMIKELKGFPVGVVVRMIEEQEKQGNTDDITVFQRNRSSSGFYKGFDWSKTEPGDDFWLKVIGYKCFDLFFEKYPEYMKY